MARTVQLSTCGDDMALINILFSRLVSLQQFEVVFLCPMITEAINIMWLYEAVYVKLAIQVPESFGFEIGTNMKVMKESVNNTFKELVCLEKNKRHELRVSRKLRTLRLHQIFS
jgi:hypothetical protein